MPVGNWAGSDGWKRDSSGTQDLGNGWSRDAKGNLVQTQQAAPQQAPQPSMPQAPGPAPEQMIQQAAQAQPEASVPSLAAAAGMPNDKSAGAAFTGAGPGVMRPGLPTQRPAPDDGGLRALERRIY